MSYWIIAHHCSSAKEAAALNRCIQLQECRKLASIASRQLFNSKNTDMCRFSHSRYTASRPRMVYIPELWWGRWGLGPPGSYSPQLLATRKMVAIPAVEQSNIAKCTENSHQNLNTATCAFASTSERHQIHLHNDEYPMSANGDHQDWHLTRKSRCTPLLIIFNSLHWPRFIPLASLLVNLYKFCVYIHTPNRV